MTQEKHRKPGTRVDGAKRIDLKAQASRRAAALSAKKAAPPQEDTRVAEVWAREDARESARLRLADQRKRMRKLTAMDGGKEGARVSVVKVKISADRADRLAMRCRPGTFEWRYGRNKQDALFHAGSHLAQLWERAGMTVASSANFLRGIASGYATDLADGRMTAIDRLRGFTQEVGRVPAERLVDYCVIGLTADEIARKNGVKKRDMAPVLHQDLRACAAHFKFLGGNAA